MGMGRLPPRSHCVLPQVDLGHVYGDNLQRQHQLRLFQDGKLKFQVLHGMIY